MTTDSNALGFIPMFVALLCAMLVITCVYMIYKKVKELQIKMTKLETSTLTDIRDIRA